MPTAPHSALGRRIGQIMSAILLLILLADATVDLSLPELVRPEMAATGFPAELAPWLGSIILICALLYAVPRTAVLGAIFVTGFAGGAICAHFRLQEIGSPPQLFSIFLGVLAWGGLYLRDERVRALLSFTSDRPSA